LAIFPQDLSRSVVLSPFSNYPVGYQCQSSAVEGLSFGISGMVESLPKGFVHTVLLYAGNNGVSNTIYDWGSIILKQSGKERTTSTSDIPTQYLGYWTDNGAYYYYNTESG
jgi:hypothetical protein